eukprot:gb/GECH01007768.1/.p1 GENE.gb/GECH01007768.1/~~gb/GECH01007768.1/.p1  ORF type:complete len:186 (+),score=48.76 gb/GECH01007768.1/:1-558(+)
MGNLFSMIFDAFRGMKEVRILMIGLDAAGKTTILYNLKIGEVVTTIPTIGFNVEELEYKNVRLTLWDVGGQDRIRDLWRHYYKSSDALIWVVDSSDQQRMTESQEELFTALRTPEMQDLKALLVFANKQDLPGSLTPPEIADTLELTNASELKGKKWFVQGASATKGEGLVEGLDWLVKALKSHH